MNITIRRLTTDDDIKRACAMTIRGSADKVSMAALYRAEHSPIRCDIYWIELIGVQSFVSVHFTRHKIGVDHYVLSNRDDRGGVNADRDTPVNHGMIINAQALINMSRKRLCLKAHDATVMWWNAVRAAVREVNPTLAQFMVPECTYRGNVCHEMRPCKEGPENRRKK